MDEHERQQAEKSLIAAEALGDASNLKGTDYHLRFAIWLLLNGETDAVSFYAGNDILASTVAPLSPDDPASLSASALAESPEGGDVWIQLKNTAGAWTCSAVLDDNLLSNFICNSYLSESRHRRWSTQLITPAEIRSSEIRNFSKGPIAYRELDKKLDQVVNAVADRLRKSQFDTNRSTDEIRARALEILQQLAESTQLPPRVLDAEITCNLVGRLVDPLLAREVERVLIAALLGDTASGKPTPRKYNRTWMSQVTGHDFVRSSPLDESVATACDRQVEENLSSGYAARDCVERPYFLGLLDDFLRSPATLFVMTGRSGTGKSWVLADWARRTLVGKIRLLTSGLRFAEESTFQSHVAGEIRHLASSSLSDSLLVAKFVKAGNSSAGPSVVILDNLRPSAERPLDYARAIARFIEDARRSGAKIVISCQSDQHRNLCPFKDVNPTDVFRVNSRGPLAASDATENTVTTVIDDFSDDELRDALSRRVAPSVLEPLLLQLRDPIFALIRNPYVLGGLPSDVLAIGRDGPIRPLLEAISSLLENRIDTKLREAERLSGISLPALNETLGEVVAVLWETRATGMSRMQLRRSIEQKSGELGRRSLDALYQSGILFSESHAAFAEPRLGARCTARFLNGRLQSFAELSGELRWKSDHDVLAQLIATSSSPIEFATMLTDSSNEWIPAVSEGLLYLEPSDPRVVALLVVLSRRNLNTLSAADAFGRFSLKSSVAWRELVRRFISPDADDREWAKRAMWTVARLAPQRAIQAVGVYLRLAARRIRGTNVRWDRDKQFEYRRRLASALSVLGNIEGKYAGAAVLQYLAHIEPLTDKSHQFVGQDTFTFVCHDPIVEEFDEVRGLASSLGNEQQFGKSLARLESTQDIERARAVSGLFFVSRIAPDAIEAAVLSRLRAESRHPLLARLLWSSYRVAQRNSEAVLSALEEDPARYWTDYEAAAATISLLETLAKVHPHKVLTLVPAAFPELGDEAVALLEELVASCRFQCQGSASPISTESAASPSASHNAPLQLYRLRAEAVKALLDVGRELGLTEPPQILRFELRDKGPDFFFLDLSEWIASVGRDCSSHPSSRRITDLLAAAACSESMNQASVLDGWRRNVRFFIARDCIDVLVAMLITSNEPTAVVRVLPADWQRMYACRQLIEKGVHHPELIDLALNECSSHANSATAQASAERNDCLIALQRVVPERVPQISQERHGLSWFFTGGRSTGSRLAAKIDEDPSSALESLESSVIRPGDAMLLRAWYEESGRWPSLLVADAYASMFRPAPLSWQSARELVKRQIVGLEGLPVSDVQAEHVAIYQAIADALDGKTVRPVHIRLDSQLPIIRSHELAREILDLKSITRDALESMLTDRRGWFEEHNYRWENDGTIGHGSGQGHYLIVFFPAVRLALYAAGQKCGWNDPAFTWMQRRRQAVIAVKDIVIPQSPQGARRTAAIACLSKLASQLPEQEIISATLGQLLLEDGQFQTAHRALSDALASPLCVAGDRARVLYNLACYFSKTGDEHSCQKHLQESNELKRLDANWLEKDPDLATSRSQPWFRNFMDSIAAATAGPD